MKSNRRAKFAGMLFFGAAVLLASILIGTRIGDHVIVVADGKSADAAADLPTPVPIGTGVLPDSPRWKRSQVVAVATDPGFPDPRVTPTPRPSPSPSARPTARPSGSPRRTSAPRPLAALTDTPPDAFPVRHRPLVAPKASNAPIATPTATSELGE